MERREYMKSELQFLLYSYIDAYVTGGFGINVALPNASEYNIGRSTTNPPSIHSIEPSRSITTYKRDCTALYTYVTTRVAMKPYDFLLLFTLKLANCSLRKKKG
jgi:hypothetical protein